MFSYSCLGFFPIAVLCPVSQLPQSIPLPHCSCSVSIMASPLFLLLCFPLPLLSPVIPLPSPSGHCQFAFISKSLALFCSFVSFADYVSLIGEIIWYVYFTTWLTSLSIMLSSSIHAVAKGRSSFFLSVAEYTIV